MLKSQLLAEAKNINATVELDGIFESVELSDEVKANFSTVFEQTVKAKAVELAESHINQIAEQAEAKLAEMVDTAKADNMKEVMENADKFLSHIASEWLTENKLAVENGIKANLFESIVVGLKELFVEHNVVVPDEEVDVVAELEDELAESKAEVTSLFDKTVSLQEEIAELKRDAELKEATRELTDSQKEKVLSLVEGLDYNDTYGTKLNAIVEMVTATPAQPAETAPLNINEAEQGANYTIVENEKEPKADPMAKYLSASRRLV